MRARGHEDRGLRIRSKKCKKKIRSYVRVFIILRKYKTFCRLKYNLTTPFHSSLLSSTYITSLFLSMHFITILLISLVNFVLAVVVLRHGLACSTRGSVIGAASSHVWIPFTPFSWLGSSVITYML